MEASIQLVRVIQEMRAEINRLEDENHALRVKLTSISQPASSSGRESEDEREEAAARDQSPRTVPGDIPIDSAPAVQEHQGTKHMWLFWAMLTFSSISQITGLLGYSNNVIIWVFAVFSVIGFILFLLVDELCIPSQIFL